MCLVVNIKKTLQKYESLFLIAFLLLLHNKSGPGGSRGRRASEVGVRRAGRWADRQTGRQRDRETDGQTDEQTVSPFEGNVKEYDGTCL